MFIFPLFLKILFLSSEHHQKSHSNPIPKFRQGKQMLLQKFRERSPLSLCLRHSRFAQNRGLARLKGQGQGETRVRLILRLIVSVGFRGEFGRRGESQMRLRVRVRARINMGIRIKIE